MLPFKHGIIFLKKIQFFKSMNLHLKENSWVCLDLDLTWKNDENHSLKSERSKAHQYHQAEKETLKEPITYFTNTQSLSYGILIFQDTKSCPKLFWSRNRISDWIWRTHAGPSNVIVALSAHSDPKKHPVREALQHHHPCFAGQNKKRGQLAQKSQS